MGDINPYYQVDDHPYHKQKQWELIDPKKKNTPKPPLSRSVSGCQKRCWLMRGSFCLASMLGKSEKNILPNRGFDGDLPWVQSVKNSP